MKTIFTLLVGSLFNLAALATDFRSSQLTVTVQDRGNYKIIVDGKKFEPYNSNSVIITNVDPGYHTVTISKFKFNPLFGILGMRTEVLYNNTIQVKPGTAISLTVDRFGKACIDEQKMKGRGRDDDDYYDNDRGNGRDEEWKDRDDRKSGYGQYNAYVNVMSNVEFQRVLDCIDKEWFETNKMKSANQIIATNYFTSDQVKQMLQLFSFESNKLELAKQSYSKTLDKQNYQCVSDVLMFRSSKEELARFISTCR